MVNMPVSVSIPNVHIYILLAKKSALRADFLLAPAECLLASLANGLASLDHEGLRPS